MLILCAACAASPIPDTQPATERFVVDLVGGSFVRFEDRRMIVEEFVYELRQRCRELGNDPQRLPWIEVRIPRDSGATAPDPGVIETIRTRAWEAGVKRIETSYDGAGA